MDDIRKVTIKDANRDELLFIAKNVLNLPVAGNIGAAKLRAQLAAVHDPDLPIEVRMADADQRKQQAAVLAKAKKQEGDDEFPIEGGFCIVAQQRVPVDENGLITVQITPSELDKDMPHVELGVNGANMIIPYSEPSPIPPAYFEVLVNASRRVPIKNRDSQIVGWQNQPRHTVSVMAPIAA